MKRYITCVSVLLLTAMLVSCGGGGGGSDGGVSATPAATNTPGTTATPDATSTPDTATSTRTASTGNAPDTTTEGTTGSTTGGTTDTTTGGTGGGTTDTPAGGSTGTTTGGSTGTPTGGTTGNDGGGTGTLPSAGALVEESDTAVTLSAGWKKSDPRYGWSGGAAMQSTVPGATVSFIFSGTSVRWIGARNKESGIALVKVDGAPVMVGRSPTGEVDLYARPREVRTNVLTIYGLSEGRHTLTIEVTGRQNAEAVGNVVVVDAFEVEPPIVSHLQETDPSVAFTAGWLQADDTLNWSGGGVFSEPDPPVGGAKLAEAAGESVTLKFRGTSIRWIGYRGPNAGIARVRVDGGDPTEIDLYAPTAKIQEVVFTALALTDEDHTLTIESTGLKNDASTAAQVVVDAFDITTPGRRYEEGDPSITYSGRWTARNVNRVWSEGVAATTEVAGSRATFKFTGTSVRYIGCQKSSIRPARIFLDGIDQGEIKNHQRDPIEAYQRVIFEAVGLTPGPHTLEIVAAGDGGFLVVDAFDVRP